MQVLKREKESVRGHLWENRSFKSGEIGGNCWTTFEVGLIHGVWIGLRFNAVVDDDGIGRMRVVTPFMRVCRCELVKSHMEGNTDLIFFFAKLYRPDCLDIERDIIDGFKTSKEQPVCRYHYG